MTAPALCDGCGTLLRFRHEMIERRVEYRAVRGQVRLRTWQTARLCQSCAAAEWRVHDGEGAREAPRLAPNRLRPDDGLGRVRRVRLGDLRGKAADRLSEDEAAALVLRAFPEADPLDRPGFDAYGRPWPPPWTRLVQTHDGPRLMRIRDAHADELAAWCAGRWPAIRSSSGMGPCDACGAMLSPTSAVEARVEYRQVGTLTRLRTWRERWLCRDCATAEAAEHDRPYVRHGEQKGLL